MNNQLETSVLAAIRHAVTFRENDVALSLVTILEEMHDRHESGQSSTVDLVVYHATATSSEGAGSSADAIPQGRTAIAASKKVFLISPADKKGDVSDQDAVGDKF